MIATNQATGETLRLEGRFDEAEAVFREMHEVYESMGETGFNSTICGLIALTLCDVGRYDEADSFAEKSRALAAEDDFASQGLWRMARARVLASSGAFEEALRLADEAVEIMEGTDYLVYQGDGHEVRGQVLEAAGRGDDARACVRGGARPLRAEGERRRRGPDPCSARAHRERLNGLAARTDPHIAYTDEVTRRRELASTSTW